jgi:hypothetical protein
MSEKIYRHGAIQDHYRELIDIGAAAAWYVESELPIDASYLERVLEGLVSSTRVGAELGPWGQQLLETYRARDL